MLYVGVALLIVGLLLHLAAFIAQIVDAFKASAAWGLISIVGLFLGGIPNLIFCLANIKERWVPLAMYFGSYPPIVVGAIMTAVEFGLMQLPS